MRWLFIVPAAVFALSLAACQDSSQPVTPEDPALAPSPELSLLPAQEAERVVPGRVLARLAPGADAEAVGQAHGVAFEREAEGGAFAFFRGAAGNERALAARMRGDTRVVWAEPDYLRQPHAIDSRLWAFYNPGGLFVTYTTGRNKGKPVTSFVSIDDADEDNVEGYGAPGGAVAIASIDTGVDFTHSEFGSANLVAGYDYYSGDADPSDTDGHGTHTTGTMVGATVGVAGVAGAASKVTVYVYRVCGPLGCPTSAIASAIRAAADNGVVAMNLSLGGSVLATAEKEAIDYATGLDALVIASAGNGGTGTVSCPACYEKAISVAASNWQDELTYYSNWGPGLDLTAPGGEMYSNTTEEGGIYSSVPGGYAYYQGTSMAAPQVTGTAAVVASKAGLKGAFLRARLEGTADDLGSSGYDQTYGNGRLNSYRAVTGGTLQEGPVEPLAAAFTYSCSGLTCTFDGSGSTGNITSSGWAFGDGGMSTAFPTVSHTYAGVGSYTVTLTVGDGTTTDVESKTVSCKLRGKTVKCG
jgi:serine protease